jgi:hypothetical protein
VLVSIHATISTTLWCGAACYLLLAPIAINLARLRRSETHVVALAASGSATATVLEDLGTGAPLLSKRPFARSDCTLRARPQIIESTFDRVVYRFTTIFPYHIVVVIDIEPIRERFSAVAPFLDERGRRLVATAEAFAAGSVSGGRLLVGRAIPTPPDC